MRLRLLENFRFLIYAPFYAAHATGAYRRAGVEVELLPSLGPGRAEQAVCDGAAEAMWAGPMRILKHHDGDPASPLVAFAEIVCRDPFSLVGREPNPGFRLADLAQLRFASVSEVPTPWLCLQEDLRQAGIDPNELDRVADFGMADSLVHLAEGRIAAAQLFEPFVEQAVGSGAGHLWWAASARGLTSYTVFATTRERLAADPEPYRRMVAAIAQTLAWVEAEPVEALAAAVASYFPDLARDALTRSLARYKAQRIWGRDPVLCEEGFDRLRRGLVSSGFISRPVPFAECVDNRLAEEVRASLA